MKLNTKLIEWLSAEEMHQDSKEWLSELLFIKDEHSFFEDLITSNTLQLLDPKKFTQNKEIIDAINRSQKRNNLFIKTIKLHLNELQIMVDGVNQIQEEKAYTQKHRDLIVEIGDFLQTYKSLKKQLFGIIKTLKKEYKQKHLLDKK